MGQNSAILVEDALYELHSSPYQMAFFEHQCKSWSGTSVTKVKSQLCYYIDTEFLSCTSDLSAPQIMAKDN